MFPLLWLHWKRNTHSPASHRSDLLDVQSFWHIWTTDHSFPENACSSFCIHTVCSLPRKTQKTDTQNEKNAPEHHVQERFLLPINGVSPLFYPFNFSSILATCRKICLSVSLLLVSFSVSSFGLSVVVVAFFANPFSPAALMIAG